MSDLRDNDPAAPSSLAGLIASAFEHPQRSYTPPVDLLAEWTRLVGEPPVVVAPPDMAPALRAWIDVEGLVGKVVASQHVPAGKVLVFHPARVKVTRLW